MATADRKQLIGALQVGAGAIMISFSAVFVKLAHVGPTMAGFYRMLFGGLILAGGVWIKGGRFYCGNRHFLIAGICSLMLVADLSFWHRSIHYVGPGLATLLASCQVFFLGALGILVFGERLTWKLVFSVPLAVGGLYLIVGINWGELRPDYQTGVIFGLIAALCYVGFILSLRKLQAGFRLSTGLSNMAVVTILGCILFGLEAWVQKEEFLIPDLQSWGALLCYGLVSQVLGWVIISAGLLKVETSRVGLLLLLQPALAFVWDVTFFARPTVAIEVLGFVLTLFAVYMGATGRKK